jgi:putative glutamine amidotransferase
MVLIVGIPACATFSGQREVHQTPARYAAAVVGGVDAVPIMIPPMGEAQMALLDTIDGLLVPGSPSNVHPSHYDGGDSLTPDHHDHERDATTLPLIRAAIARGIPVLAICRGIQELNVALGGTLIQQVHERSNRLDHRGGQGSLAQRYGPRHSIATSGLLRRIVGFDAIVVNSLHGQAIEEPAPGLVVDARATDGTIEAVSAPHAPGFVLGLQWHPEWRFAENPDSVAIFRAFGNACRDRRKALQTA